MGLKRGDVITVAPPGEFGKPRPAVVIQTDNIPDWAWESVTFLPITSDLLRLPGVRISIEPNEANGLRKPSDVMVDLIQTVAFRKTGGVIGKLDGSTMRAIDAALMVYLGLA